MTETAVEPTPIPEGSAAWISWRDAITPRSRASRRRWAVFYPWLLVVAAAQAGWGHVLGIRASEGDGPSLIPVVLLFLVFGMLRRSTRRLTAVDHPDLDERDQLARASAFRLAYPLLLVVALASAVVLAFVLPDVSREIPRGRDVTEIQSGQLLQGAALAGIVLWAFLWAVFLPTATLAWREPDAVPHEGEELSHRGRPSELVRDAVLAVGFLVAIAADAASDDGTGLLVLVPTLCLVASRARHWAGQQPISRHIGALGIVLVAFGTAVPAIALFDDGGSTPTSGWAASIAMLALGAAILVLERTQGRRSATRD